MTRSLALVLGVLALALATFLWLRDAPVSSHRVAPVASARPTSSSTPRPVAPPPTPHMAPIAADAVPTALEPDEPELLPPPTADQIAPRPERVEATPDEVRAQKLASLDLITRGIERLEREREAAARAGDAETARLNVHRIERLRRRSAELEDELASDAADLEAARE